MAKPPPQKRHHTERYRIPCGTVERWTRAQAAQAAFLHAQNYNSEEIAARLGNGIIAPTVRAMLRRRWGLPAVEKGMIANLPKATLKRLETLASARGMSAKRYLSRIVFIAVRDDLYSAIVPPGDEKGP